MTSELKKTVLTYVGKELGKIFENDDGSKTKSFRVKFKKDPEQEGYPISFWSYDKTKGFENLEEGEEYTIGYIEKENPKGNSPINNARFFGTPSDKDREQNSGSTVVKRQHSELPNEEALSNFESDYKKQLKEGTEDTTNRFVLTWFLNKHTEEFQKVMEYAKKR